MEDYDKFKGIIEIPPEIKGCICLVQLINKSKLLLEYQWNNTLRYVRIHFDTPTFDRITKDRAAKFVDKLSAIGGTMGLLTGFSIISGVEIIYFAFKLVLSFVKTKK